MENSTPLADIGMVVVWGALVAAGILIVLGVIDLIVNWSTQSKTRAAVEKAVAKSDEVNTAGKQQLEEYASTDLKGYWEALATLATAVKDLDRSSRLFFIALAFVAVAGVTSGFEAIGEAIAALGG